MIPHTGSNPGPAVETGPNTDQRSGQSAEGETTNEVGGISGAFTNAAHQSQSEPSSSEPSAEGGKRDTAVRRVSLSNYRNYRVLDLAIETPIVMLTGANGAGKTNLLEALSLLSPGRGLRNARIADLGRVTRSDGQEDDSGSDAGGDVEGGVASDEGTGGWSVRVDIDMPERAMRIETRAETAKGSSRQVSIDGQIQRSQQALSDELGVVWMTPDMDRLFHDSAGQRRRFLDRLVYGFDPDHASRVTAYTKTIRERARLLKDQRSGARSDETWLSTLEARAAAQGIAIAAARNSVVSLVNTALVEAHRRADDPDGLPHAEIGLSGIVEGWLTAGNANDAEDAFRDALASQRREDSLSGRTGTGPHRSDLIARHLGLSRAADQCSTGEQRGLLLALVLAYAECLSKTMPAPPLLLVDEAMAHLDINRRTALLERLIAFDGQVWMTGTDPINQDQLPNKRTPMHQSGFFIENIGHFHVDCGAITPI
jgi:DNA replication and repair protein RecF